MCFYECVLCTYVCYSVYFYASYPNVNPCVYVYFHLRVYTCVLRASVPAYKVAPLRLARRCVPTEGASMDLAQNTTRTYSLRAGNRYSISIS